jgi:hypothetical protein
MRYPYLLLLVLMAPACRAQEVDPAAPPTPAPAAAVARTEFQIRYINGSSVYIDGGTTSGLREDTELILKQSTSLSDQDPANAAIEPGVIARLKVVSVASTSAVCEIVATKRDLTEKDVLSLPEVEIKKITDKDTVGSTRHYPMVISFSEGDPMDEEVHDAVPRPPLPEINQMRGRFGFDVSSIQQLGQSSSIANEYGMVVRADFTRMFGTYWNLNGYWRGTLQNQNNAAAENSIQNLMNRTYLMSLNYINPNSAWTASIGRMYLPYASSLETVDGVYLGRKTSARTVVALFAGSSPNPTAWNYDPSLRVGGGFFNIHGGTWDGFHYSSTGGAGVDLLKWNVNRPFFFTENEFSFKKYFSLYQAMQIDKPTPNPGQPPINWGLGESLISARVSVIPRVTLELTDTYFRSVPTYDAILVGTGLLDKYLYQGLNGGVRVTLPLRITGYASVGQSNTSNDNGSSLNELFGASIFHIGKTGLGVDARYSKFDSAFASGKYSTLSINRDLGERFRLDLQAGRYDYNSSLAQTSNSYFGNAILDMDLGARLFFQSMFTAQRGGSIDYNQWTTTVGYRFDNRAAMRAARANHQ